MSEPAQDLVNESTQLTEAVEQKTMMQTIAQPENVSPLAMMLSSGEHDMEKINRYWEIQKDWENRESLKAFVAAKANIRRELKPIAKNQKNAHLNSEYADIDAMLDGVGPIAGKYGVDVDFEYDQTTREGWVITICHASHENGHTKSRKAEFPIMEPIRGAKGNATNGCQMVGVSMTYGRRYSFAALFAVACGNDQDGNHPQQIAAAPELINDKQVSELVSLLDAADERSEGFKKRWTDLYSSPNKFGKTDSVLGVAVPAAKFEAAKKSISDKLESLK